MEEEEKWAKTLQNNLTKREVMYASLEVFQIKKKTLLLLNFYGCTRLLCWTFTVDRALASPPTKQQVNRWCKDDKLLKFLTCWQNYLCHKAWSPNSVFFFKSTVWNTEPNTPRLFKNCIITSKLKAQWQYKIFLNLTKECIYYLFSWLF